jgi:short-subunit dehydrogenase
MQTEREHTALVTGASAGIGAAVARELAARGNDLVLTARRLDRLRELEVELREQFGADVLSVGADLADPNAVRLILTEVEHAGRRVDILVNNAGYGLPGWYLDIDWGKHADFIRVLVTAVCEMTHRLLPGMIERRYGRVVNVASVAGLLPGSAGSTLYNAAKSFLIKFTESLWLELRGTGVHLTAVCPGLTYSEFHDVSGTRDKVSKMPSYMWMDAETVARQALLAVEQNVPVYVNGAANRLVAGVAKHVPNRVALSLSDRQSRRFDAG